MSLSLIVLTGFLSHAVATDCKVIEDSEKRSFADRNAIVLPLDGDGLPVTIVPRTYTRTIRRNLGNGYVARESHWITFDLVPSGGRTLRSFFRYEYGTDVADYWVYALVPCDVNKDGRTDLIFYAGDDTSDETVVLLNKRGRFVVSSRRQSEAAY
jgi:hypothetical protein